MRYLWGLGDLVLDARWGSRSGLNNNKGERAIDLGKRQFTTRSSFLRSIITKVTLNADEC
ncbi:MAG: hypothetical protein EAZ23_24175 [Oscillatoriales cyanobacterium]|nr:MAG: hypothetical protein EAZ23_24175 [Oscillatoriales cyanobacterium]